MKLILALIAAFILGVAGHSAPAVGGEPTPDSSDDNPGHIDSPAAVDLIVAEMQDNKMALEDYTIKYFDSKMLDGNKGAYNRYLITNKKTGVVQIFTILVMVELAPTA